MPNVVLFFTDQQRFDTTGLHGNPMGLTPNFDRMAREGTHFANMFTCQPVCAPARATLQSGLYSSNTGVWRNGLALDPALALVPRAFSAAGFTTAYIGKWHLASAEPVPRAEQAGYDHWLGANLLEHVSDAYDTVLFDREGRKHTLPGYRVDALTDAAIRFIDAHRDERFFLTVSYLEPHHQNRVDAYPAPTGYEQNYLDPWVPPDLRALGGSAARHLPGYYGMVRRVDEALGRIEDALRSLGLLDDTIIVFVTDHGNHFKTRNAEYKRSCHEATIRLPCFATGPGFTGGGRVDELVSLVDLPPTMLDAAGVDVPARMEGRSVLPLLRLPGGPARARSLEWPDHVFVQISESQTARAVRTRRWKYSVAHEAADGPATGPALEHADAYTEEFLYDLAHDPYELENLVHAASHAPVRERLRSLLSDRIRVVEGRDAQIIEATPRPSGQRKVGPEEVLE